MKDKQPLVTIITITRNRASLIPRCIESIQCQTYKFYEHIIIDGASEDDTYDIVASYNDSKIKYVKLNKNLSMVESYDIAIEKANGKYITFLDDDDEYVSTKIEKQVNLIESLPEEYGMVYCWMDYYDDKQHAYLYTHKTELSGDVSLEVVEKPTVSGTPTFLIRKDAFIKAGRFQSHGIDSDWEFGARFCQLYKVDFVHESLVNVYINHGSKRMSENGYYKNSLERNVIFHNYFLNQFSSIFDNYPRKSIPHLYTISSSLMKLGKWKEAKSYYVRLVRLKPSVKSILLPIYCFFKRVQV